MTHYYAYGLRIQAISSKKLGEAAEGHLLNQHLYNDKELIEEGDLGWYDYGFRNYDPQIGRFPQLDPLTHDFPFLTPYQYASCDPITNIDLDGLEGVNATGEALRRASIITVNISKNASQGASLLGTIGSGVSLVNSGFSATRNLKDQICSQCPTLNMNLKEPVVQTRQAEFRQLDMSYRARQARQQTADFYAQQKARQGATMDAFAVHAITPMLNFTMEVVQSPLRNGYGVVENINDGNGWKAAGFGMLLMMDASPFFKGGGGASKVAYRAIDPRYAESTLANGFYRSGAPGRLGNDGIYANSTIEGAIKEFQHHNPGIKPAVFEVKYKSGNALHVNPPPSLYYNQPLPFTQGANILVSPSLRAPGTTNLLIREGAQVGKRIQ
ncbi:hypothetical protein HRH25_23185 [Flavisolibacter sp. BT320]|nr:hypothetical protein [Flavisolibacter longurius]